MKLCMECSKQEATTQIMSIIIYDVCEDCYEEIHEKNMKELEESLGDFL